MSEETLPTTPSNDSTALTAVLTAAGAAADRAAAAHVFTAYQQTKAANTLKRQRTDLNCFATYLNAAGIAADGAELMHRPASWQGMSWGLVKGFLAWQLQEGYAVATINARLTTVRVYARLAAQAGFIDGETAYLIAAVKGFARKEARHVDEKRPQTRKEEITYAATTRAGETITVTRDASQKPAPVPIDAATARRLKTQPDTPGGRRNAFIMCLLLDHGLRADEVANLRVGDLYIKEEQLRFYRPKVDKTTRHRLTADTLHAARAYLAADAPADADKPLFRPGRKGGALVADTDRALSRVSVSRLVKRLGRRLAQESGNETLSRLSAHDCRHYAATDMARRGYDVKHLMQWFGWSSPTMAMRYVADAEVVARDRG